MPLFRVHITHPDLSVQKLDYTTEFAEGARELASRYIKDNSLTGTKVSKVKLVRDERFCCCNTPFQPTGG